MPRQQRNLKSIDDRGPLRVMFLMTSMPVGGAETLLVNLIRRLDRDRFTPSLCCLKDLGPLGELMSHEVSTFSNLIRHKYDLGVVLRLARLFREQRIDAIVTVGAGDKMFWGRLAARWAGVPVVLSAIHSTGWPDGIGRLNRSPWLTRWTDAFIGVADAHGIHLIENEGFPVEKVCIIPNGVDVSRFHPELSGKEVRRALGIDPQAPVAGIVAALRPEKDHALFLRAAARVLAEVPAARFMIVGDGPLRGALENQARELGIQKSVHFLGTRKDIPELLAAMDVFVLTSKMEANPVSILEAMACGKPVVAPRVGSIAESVLDGSTGFLTEASAESEIAQSLIVLLADPALSARMGRAGRASVVAQWSLERMVDGYEALISDIYTRKAAALLRQDAAGLTQAERQSARSAPLP